MLTLLKMIGYGALNGVAVVLAWKGLDYIIYIFGGIPTPKEYWTVFCAAAAGAGNVIGWMED